MSECTTSADSAKPLLATSVGRLRVVGLLEGTSFLALLFIAMPLKYMADEPLGVYILGRAHGALWLLYLIALMDAWLDNDYSRLKAGALFMASILPFGPFIADGYLKRDPPPRRERV